MGNDLLVILPAHNEESAIASVINEVERSASCKIALINSASTDRTPEIARSMGIPVYDAPKGKGNAIAYAFRVVDAPYVVMLDSDATYPARHIPEVYDELRGGADVVIGVRKYLEPGAFPPLNRGGNRFITGVANLLYGTRLQDLCTGMWGFRRNVIKNMSLSSPGFTLEADMFVNCVRSGYRIAQVPISYRKREGERKINRMDHIKILLFLLKRRFN